MSEIQTNRREDSPRSHQASEETAIARLPTDQQLALEAMLVGKSITESARAAGVSRSTIYFWLNHDPAFRASFNLWHDQLQQSYQWRLLTMTDRAADAVEKALERGDARLGLQLLKGLGILAPRPIGPTDADEMKATMDLQRQQRQIVRKREEAKLYMDNLKAEGGL